MHGPGPVTPTNPPGWEPTYPQPIRVVDTFTFALGTESKRTKWRSIRDTGLALWSPVTFDVEELPPSDFGEWEVIPGAIRIIKGAAGHDSGGWIESDAGGLMVLGPWPPWWKRYWFRSAVAIVGHESGHCLGLWHREDGGIMSGGNRPDDHDIRSIRNYYDGA